MSFTDPPDSKSVMQHTLRLKKIRSDVEYLRYVHRLFPKWFYDVADSFNRQDLNKNWKLVCKKAGTKPKKIITVNKIVYYNKDKTAGEYSLLLTIMDSLTKRGYCVRDKRDLTLCKECKKVFVLSSRINKENTTDKCRLCQ